MGENPTCFVNAKKALQFIPGLLLWVAQNQFTYGKHR